MITTDARVALERLVAAAREGRLDAICERFGVIAMSAFGSATRAGGWPPDDLDVGVLFDGRDPTLGRFRLALWEALVDLLGYEGIDLVVLNVDDPVLRSEALTGIPLYERESGQYAEAQIAALGERRDTAHLRRMNLELMAR